MKKMLVVAECVETEEIRSAVHALGIDYVQGYLIGLPVELDTLLETQPSQESALAVTLPPQNSLLQSSTASR